MDPVTMAAISLAFGQGLSQVANRLVEQGAAEPGLEASVEKLKVWVAAERPLPADDSALSGAIRAALAAANAPLHDETEFDRWARGLSLDRLVAPNGQALRRQLAQAVLGFTNAKTEPPSDLVMALGWPRAQSVQLSNLLVTLRAQLYTLEGWRAPIEYADAAAQRGFLQEMLEKLSRFDNVLLHTDKGEALRVVVAEQGINESTAAQIETRYRLDLVRELRNHDFRGITQVRKDIRLPLADIYLELGLLTLEDETERQRMQTEMVSLTEKERRILEERRLQERIIDSLSGSSRLVILGEPGAGKTISLKFIALMLAHGYGAGRLGLDIPYIPLLVRLASYARDDEGAATHALDNFLLRYIEQEYSSHPQLGQFLRLALEKGACMILLDGLDEIGLRAGLGQATRGQVARRVQQFADRWCNEERPNRLIVTSRLEGYWQASLTDFDHVQLSPLRPPDEVEAFLRRWYIAHERAYDAELPLAVAEQRVDKLVTVLLNQIMGWDSVRRLATNPLLLTILALIYENLGRLPNRRIQLYAISAQTLIDSWRQAQTNVRSDLLVALGEETFIRVMAPLAYWLHEERPGGTASEAEWRERLLAILTEEGFEDDAAEVAELFLDHARYETGLLAERGLGQYGFFHLTFEEYLAAREIARKRTDERRAMIQKHWQDPRWREVILLAAGQLGIMEARRDEVSDFIVDLLEMEPVEELAAGELGIIRGAELNGKGRQVVLAGRALADIGARSVTPRIRFIVLDALRETMQDLNPETKRPLTPPQISIRTRFEAGEVLDELGWLPTDLNDWVRCFGCADNGVDLLATKYLVSNAQYHRFVLDGGYEDAKYWGGPDSPGWRWRMREHPHSRGEGPITEPRYWHNVAFGKGRRGFPVVGVSWFEAAAYANWLTELLTYAHQNAEDMEPEELALIQDLYRAGAREVRLPTENEWQRLAGGLQDLNRYAWDKEGEPVTQTESAIVVRANTLETELRNTTPVAMYPLGASVPYGLYDMSGNVFEWTAAWYDEAHEHRVLRGGSWHFSRRNARVVGGYGLNPGDSDSDFGFRLVASV